MSWIILAISHGNILDSYFVNDYHDTSMDYFNMVSYLDEGNPYIMDANYPPMCFFILRIFYHFIPTFLRGGNGFYYKDLMHAQILYIIYTSFLLISTWELTKKSHDGNYFEQILLATCVVFSGPILFALERGNLILICLPCLVVFIKFYNSTEKTKRWCAYIALSIAASIKLYPALFGILILQKKRYKEAIQTIILGLVMFILPCLAFDGLKSISGMLHGIVASSELQSNLGPGYNFSFTNLLRILSILSKIDLHESIITKFVIPFSICAMIYLSGKEEWKKIYAISLLCIWIPEFSYTYTLMLMILPLLLFLKRNHGIFGYIYQLCFVIILTPICLPQMKSMDLNAKFPLTLPTIVINIAICIFTITIIIENLMYKKLNKLC